jgi:hypothetical protein
MENAVEALKMAGSVLLFVLALSLAILNFSKAREAIDAVLKYSDRESLTIENDPRFYYLAEKSDTKRYVGKETIIPTIYRSYKENFKIVFDFNDYYLYTKVVTTKNSDGTVSTEYNKKIKKIDLENESIGSDLVSRQFLNGIVYGNYEYEDGKTKADFNERFGIVVNNSKTLYEVLTEAENNNILIEECLGTYIQEEVVSSDQNTAISVSGTDGTDAIPDNNETEKRVITYKFK